MQIIDGLPTRARTKKPSRDQIHATRALHVTRFALYQGEVEFLFLIVLPKIIQDALIFARLVCTLF